jgi:ABC-type molybdate transport system ATPase subunit
MKVFPISAARLLVRLVAVSLFAAPMAALSAQGTIRGKVVEIGTERPIAEVQVKVTGTPTTSSRRSSPARMKSSRDASATRSRRRT